MKLHEKIKVEFGKETRICAVEEWRRKGTMSPTTLVVRYDGRRYAPYAQRKYNIWVSVGSVLTILYRDLMKDILYHDNPLMKKIKPARWAGNPVKVPYGVA